MYPGAPAVGQPSPVRPPPVTAAVAILILMGVVGLVHALAGLAVMARVVDRVRNAAHAVGVAGSDADTVVWGVRAGAIAAALIGLLFAFLLILLAFGIARGSSAARVGTWVVCAFGLLCGCATAIATLGQRAVEVEVAGSPGRVELLGALADAYPAWWIWLSGGLSVSQALGYLVVALLLALPASTAFFRREPPVSGPPPASGPVPPSI
ncbi:hypothetical protein SAMN05444365_1011125 [Micromonospora pattaloongensis]|uniref:Uncharacterized protein n=1 Tax=Micromonospora pattaloongensis TaxID=405436 RepID=A0A1H3I523_9ACTN|nr:hypothetical protein [Micromonospora pattaloongensis]SDY22732.1 hypothetical protein SAMN05444365_1011125 [Micromonospora pattaloongensis]